jgi:hypothetical protein
MSQFPPRPPSSSPSTRVRTLSFGFSPSASEGGTSFKARSSTPPVVVGELRRPTPPIVVGELRTPTPPATGRQVTPSKVSRSSTPDGSARSGSATRIAVPLALSGLRSSSVHKARVNLAQASFDAQRAQRARSVQTSTRKLWRHERDNPALLRGPYGMTTDFDDYDLDFEEAITTSPKVDWRSLFSKLFQQQHFGQMEAFRGCAEGSLNTHSTVRSKRRMRKDVWASAEKAWLLVEKRLRTSVQEAMEYRPDILNFVQSFEALLMYFAEKLDVPPSTLVPPPLASVLAQPLELRRNASHNSRSKSKSKNKIELKMESNDIESSVSSNYSIRINVSSAGSDSAFYRLFVHATSQFYGFKSSSVTENGERITVVTAPAKITSKKTPMIAEAVSLSAFLGHLVEEERVNETQVVD